MDLFVQPVPNHKGIDESEPVGLHWMVLLFVISAHAS
jgi:hypothetical protein